MAIKKLTTISNFLGLSSDTKPLDNPDGSTFCEYDTGIFYIFANGAWEITDRYLQPISSASPVVDVRSLELFEQMFVTLKKIEYHLSIASDTELKDHDV